MKSQDYIDRKLRAPKKFFDWCYSQISTITWLNKKQTITSHRKNCKETVKRLTKKSNLNFFDKYYIFVIVLVTEKKIEIQSYIFYSRYNNGLQNIKYELYNFELFENNKHIQCRKDYFINGYSLGLNRISSMSGCYTGAKFYDNDFEEKIKTISELKYLTFKTDITIYDIYHCYKYKDEIEFLQKINARKLADDVMYPKYDYQGSSIFKTVDMRTINKLWLRKNKRFFKNSDRDFMSFELEQRIKDRNGTVVTGIEKYLNYKDINHIPREIGIVRFQNWIIKNKIDFQYYKDYLSVLNDLKIELNENLICPKNLQKAHDEAVKLLNQLKREAEEKEYSNRLKKILKLEKEIDGYVFVVPKKIKELIQEGKALHHCVGGSHYLEQHRKGQTTIIFVRKKDDKKRPLYTMEFKNNCIIQMRGKHNQEPSQKVKDIANLWLKQINKTLDWSNKK